MKRRVWTPDELDRNDYYAPVPMTDISRGFATMVTVLTIGGFVCILLLLWWFSQP